MATKPKPIYAAQTVFVAAQSIDPSWSHEWDELAMHAAEPTSFMERWFLTSAIDNVDCPPSLKIAFIWGEGGKLDGVMPLHIGNHYGRMPIRHVRNWAHHNCFLGLPLVRKGRETAFWSALLVALDQSDWAVGLIHLTDLTENGPVHTGLIAAASILGRDCATVYRTERALLQSDLCPVAYYETTVRKKKRKEINRLRTRLAELGTLHFSTLGDPEDAVRGCDDFLALERSGWKGEAGSALGSCGKTEVMFRTLIKQGMAAGRIELQKLCLDNRPIAMLVNFIALPGSFSFKIAYDEDFARFSPGVLIQIENLALLERPGFGWMDSCAVENHPMINSLWGERRALAWVTVPLGGVRHGMIFRIARMVESAWATLKRLGQWKGIAANDNRADGND